MDAEDPGFQARVLTDDDDVLKLAISGSNGAFSGSAEVYEAVGHLRATANLLDGFPQSVNDARTVELGSSVHGKVSLRFICRGAAARTFVEVRIDLGANHIGTVEQVCFTARVEASAVDTFVADLRGLTAEKRGAAYLSLFAVA